MRPEPAGRSPFENTGGVGGGMCASQQESFAILALSRVLSSVQQRRVLHSSHGPREVWLCGGGWLD